ncbi:MAG: hypothetical protein ABEK01_00940 [Candidatus Nanohaloarchaea archaeon]
MDEGLLHHASLTVFGLGVLISSAADIHSGPDLFSVLMAVGGAGLVVTAGAPMLRGDHGDGHGNWTYLLALGAAMMFAGAVLRALGT